MNLGMKFSRIKLNFYIACGQAYTKLSDSVNSYGCGQSYLGEGEVNGFSSSFSDEDQKAPSLLRVRKPLPCVELIFKPELLFFSLIFLAAFEGKGWHVDRKEVFGT